MPRQHALSSNLRPARRLPAVVLAAVAGQALLTGAALGQNALGDGRALDKNLSTQGRVNTQVKDLESQIRFNNQIIEGRAGGGRSFRGSVGYRSTDDFGGSLGGTNTLFSFRRDALGSALASTPGIRSSDALQFQAGLSGGGGGGGRISAASVNSLFIDRPGAIATGNTALQPLPEARGLGSATVSSLRSISQYQSNAALLPTILGYAGDQQGGRVAVTASPLLGITSTPLSSGVDTRAGGSGAGPSGGPGNNPNASSLTGLERRAFGVLPPSAVAPREGAPLEPSASLARPIDQRLQPSNPSYQIVVEGLNRAIDQRAPAAPGAAGSSSPPPPSPGAAPTSAPKTGPDGKPLPPGAAGAKAPAPRPEWLTQLDQLRARLKGDNSDGASTATPPAPTAPTAPTAANDPTAPAAANDPKDRPAATPTPPGAGPAKAPGADESVLDLLNRLEARISTFKVNPENLNDAYARNMGEGEARMAAGEFFNAEGAFALALIVKPEDLMAQVGRTHAQLGAGLLVSSASGLRTILAEHPELIPVKYGPNLLPPRARAEEIVSRIRAELQKPDTGLGADGPLLVAYLGRQHDRGDWIREGIEGMTRLTKPDDARGRELLAVLRELWLVRPAPAAAPPAAPADPAK